MDAPKSLGLVSGTERFAWQDPVPPGFQEVTAVRKGLLITGAAVFGGLYLYSAVVGASGGLPWLFVPVVGPMVVGAQALSSSGGSLPFFSTLFGLSFVAVGALQAIGATLAVVGVTFPVRWLERARPTVGLRLAATPGGLLLAGSF